MWDPPAQPNGIITSYVVLYSVYRRNMFMMSEKLMGNDTNYGIESLGKYNISVSILV